MSRVVKAETESLSSYFDLIKKVVLLIGDQNLSTCKLAAGILTTIGNDIAAVSAVMVFVFGFAVGFVGVLIKTMVHGRFFWFQMLSTRTAHCAN